LSEIRIYGRHRERQGTKGGSLHGEDPQKLGRDFDKAVSKRQRGFTLDPWEEPCIKIFVKGWGELREIQ